MKRQTYLHALLRFLLCCLICLSTLLSYAATTVTIGDLKYDLDETSKEAVVTGMVEGVTEVVIPEIVNYEGDDYSVTEIGYLAFSGCSQLKYVTIPNSVTEIGSSAFWHCDGLAKVEFSNLESMCKIEYGDSYANPLTYTHNLWIAGENITEVNIPNSITSIKDYAFIGCNGLTSVTVPNSVTSIGNYAFASCSGLTSITMGNSITSIGTEAFYRCSGLTSITMPHSVTSIGYYAFASCSGLTSVTIPISITKIDIGVFHGCTGLTSVTIPDSVTEIGGSAFSECSGLTTVTIPNSVTSIESSAFYGCSSLTSVTIPKSVTEIGREAFYDCSLTAVTIPNSVTSIGNCAFNGCIGLKELIIEDGEKELSLGHNSYNGQGLFYDCPMERLYLGRNLNYKTGQEYGYSPFYFKRTLTSLTIGNSVTSISNDAFRDCSGLTSITIPNSVTSIGSAAFYGCSGLTSVNIPNSVTEIGREAFYDCSGLTSVTIPNSVTEISNSAFNGCIGLKELIIEDGEKELSLGHNSYNGQGLFYDCPMERLYLGRNLNYKTGQEYGYSPFYSKTTLTSLSIGTTVKSIGEHAFSGCQNTLSVYTYSHYINNIENCGLQRDANISILIKDEIQDDLFNTNLLYFDKVLVNKGNTLYTFVTAPDSFDFTNCIASSAGRFLVETHKDCSVKAAMKYEYAYFRGDNISAALSSASGFSFIPSEYHRKNVIEEPLDSEITEEKVVIVNPAGNLFNEVGLQDIEKIEKLKIKGDLNGTDIMTINRMKSLKFLDISDANIVEGGTTYRENLKTENNVIGSYFFSDIELQGLKLSNSATLIDQNAFNGMNSMRIVEIGKNTSIIKESAFSGCSSLSSLIIPNSVTEIANYAFLGCTGLRNLTIEDGEQKLSLGYNDSRRGLFYDCPLESLYLGRTLSYNMGQMYGYSPFYSKTRLTSLTIGNSVTIIGESAFSGCSGLTSVTIPNSVTSIGWSAFSGCSSMTSITIPNSITSIGSAAFAGCRGLTSITIPNQVRSIGEFTFYGCSGLTAVTIPGSVTSIENQAFDGCTGLKDLNIKDGSRELSLGYNAYSSSSTGKGLFYDCPLENLYLGRNLSYQKRQEYGYSPFYSKMTLTSVTIGNSVTEISYLAFLGCSRLEKAEFSSIEAMCNINYGQANANPLFYAHNLWIAGENITEVNIPNSVTSIKDYAFIGCNGLTSVTIPNSVKSIGSSAFQGCVGLVKAEFSSVEAMCKIKYWSADANPLYKAHNLWIAGEKITEVNIPNSVTSINNYAFIGCSGLTSVNIPNTVTSIGESAFSGCYNLESAVLSNNLTEIQSGTFQNTGLKEIEIPDKVESIGKDAFRGCVDLEKVILPASLTKAEAYAFGESPAIKEVYSLNPIPPVIDSTVFDTEVEENATLHVRRGSMVHYWLDPVWKEFKNMNEDLLCLDAIPAATYGDGEIDLSQYAPEDVKLRYESSNSDVVEINGNIMRIVGAGEATVGAIFDEEPGTPMELMGQMRQFTVDKADLEITVAEITIEAGQPLPDFSYLAEGLKYDDTLEDIDELPQPICEVDENSREGEYPIYFSEGNDRNYNISTKESRVTVGKSSAVDKISDDMSDENSDVEVYTLNGMLIYKGSRKEAQLDRGVYIVRQGKVSVKINVE